LAPASRADLLRRLGRSQKSRVAYETAIELAVDTAETRPPDAPLRPVGIAPTGDHLVQYRSSNSGRFA